MKVRAWARLRDPIVNDRQYGVSEIIEVPDSCADDNGDLIEEDVVEFVEEWLMENQEYGARPVGPSSGEQEITKPPREVQRIVDLLNKLYKLDHVAMDHLLACATAIARRLLLGGGISIIRVSQTTQNRLAALVRVNLSAA